MLLIEVTAVHGHFCLKENFVPTFEESEEKLMLGWFFQSVNLKVIFIRSSVFDGN